MRILVVQESDWLEKGPHQSHHLMERMSAKGHEVRVIDFEIAWRKKRTGHLLSRRREFNGISKVVREGPVVVVRPLFIRIPILDLVSISISHWIEIRKQLRDFRPDVVVCFGVLNAHHAIRLSRAHGIPTVYYVIDELHRLLPVVWLQAVARFFERSNMRRADLVLSINEALRDYTIAMGAESKKTEVLRAGVSLKTFTMADGARRVSVRNTYGFSNGDTVLFFMGWLYRFSGLKEMINELSEPVWAGRKTRLLIVGTGDLWDEIEEVIRERDLGDRVTLEGWKNYSEIPSLLWGSDICVLPALNTEIMRNIVPIKMYEYMAAGKPVIATRLPGIIKEFQTGHGVTYVDRPEDVLHLAYELACSNQVYQEGKKARAFVEGNDWAMTTDRFEKVIQSMRVGNHVSMNK